MVGNLPGRSCCQRLVHARLASLASQYHVSVSVRPCAACRPSPFTSLANTSRPANFCPPLTMPNSAPCLIELMVSPPALARPMIFAFQRMTEGIVGGEEEPGIAAGLHQRLAGAVGEHPGVVGPVQGVRRAFGAGERRGRSTRNDEHLVLIGRHL